MSRGPPCRSDGRPPDGRFWRVHTGGFAEQVGEPLGEVPPATPLSHPPSRLDEHRAEGDADGRARLVSSQNSAVQMRSCSRAEPPLAALSCPRTCDVQRDLVAQPRTPSLPPLRQPHSASEQIIPQPHLRAATLPASRPVDPARIRRRTPPGRRVVTGYSARLPKLGRCGPSAPDWACTKTGRRGRIP